MLTLGREKIDCRFSEKHTVAPFFPKQISREEEEEKEKEEEEEVKFWDTWIRVGEGKRLALPLHKYTLR